LSSTANREERKKEKIGPSQTKFLDPPVPPIEGKGACLPSGVEVAHPRGFWGNAPSPVFAITLTENNFLGTQLGLQTPPGLRPLKVGKKMFGHPVGATPTPRIFAISRTEKMFGVPSWGYIRLPPPRSSPSHGRGKKLGVPSWGYASPLAFHLSRRCPPSPLRQRLDPPVRLSAFYALLFVKHQLDHRQYNTVKQKTLRQTTWNGRQHPGRTQF